MNERTTRWARQAAAATLTAMLVCQAAAQPPADANGAKGTVCTRRGRIHRMFHHTAHTVHDDFIGDPDTFVEPPLGTYMNRQFAVQVSKADPHRFTVYQSDFLPDSNRFSPTGASRFNLMYGRLASWPGPILVEWTPDRPELAESRRQAIIATLAAAGRPIVAERVLIGPPFDPGAIGTEAAGHYNNTITRSEAAVRAFPLSPIESASMGVR